MIGVSILHYKIIKKLGEGGMGIVYLAEDAKLERKVAIKFLPAHISVDSDERIRFETEAKAAAALNHPNIATIHAIEEADDKLFLVMEYVEGRELKEILKNELPQQKAQDYAVQIAKGLQVAHKNNIVHRDIKSSNIMITNDDQVKIMDFGLAKMHGSPNMTKAGSTVGTPYYMSPEQARGEEIDQCTDIWSLGVVLFEMLTGELPFKADYEQAVIYSILNEEPVIPPEIEDSIPAALKSVIQNCLQKDKTLRYQSMNEVIDNINGPDNEVSASDIKPAKATSGKKSYAGFLFISFIIIAAILGYWIFATNGTNAQAEKIRLVVLPFENLGPAEEEYFAEGMTEEITSRLASLNSLGVISRKSALLYRNTDKSIKEISDELGVKYILEGTVRWARTMEGTEKIRITPQLIQAEKDIHIWTEIYEHAIDDIFKIQSEIAHKVVKELGVTLGESEKDHLNEKHTENIEAYHSYLRGIYFLNRPHFTRENWLKAMESLKHAVELDPEFALAYSALAKSHSRMYFVRYDLTQQRLAMADSAASKALRYGNDVPEIHLNLGYYYLWAYRDSDKALKEFRIAEKGLPNNADLQKALSSLYSTLGQWDLYIQTIKKGLRLSPRDPGLASELAFAYWFGREYDLGLEASNKAIEISPDSNWPYYYKANIIWSKSGPDDISQAALENASPEHSWWMWNWYWQETGRGHLNKALDLLPQREGKWMKTKIAARPKAMLAAFIYDIQNKKEQAKAGYDSARVLLEAAIKETPDDPRYHSSLGIAYAGIGKNKEAIREGEKAVELLPISKDAIYGTLFATDLAHIYTLTGDNEKALKQLEELLIKPSMLSGTWLKNDIRFARLRDNPAFIKLCEKYVVENL